MLLVCETEQAEGAVPDRQRQAPLEAGKAEERRKPSNIRPPSQAGGQPDPPAPSSGACGVEGELCLGFLGHLVLDRVLPRVADPHSPTLQRRPDVVLELDAKGPATG